MPGKASDKGADIALDAITGRATQTARTMYLALLTAAPTDATTLATMSEYAAAGYARQTFTPSVPAASGANRRSANTNSLSYGPLTGATGAVNITHCALVSALSGTTGDLVYYWTLDNARTPQAGDTITVAASGVAADID
jgi:hypothetical protein